MLFSGGFVLLVYFVSPNYINKLSSIVKQISVCYVDGMKEGVLVLLLPVSFNKSDFNFGPESGRVTWQAACAECSEVPVLVQ